MGRKLNAARGPTAFVLPIRGQGPTPIRDFTNPDAEVETSAGWAEFRKRIKQTLKSGIRYIELDVTFNDPLYTRTVLEVFDEMTSK